MAENRPADVSGGHPGIEQLADLDAGVLQAAQNSWTRAHVDDCASCRGALSALATTRADLGALPPVAMPDDVSERLSAALAAQSEPPAVAIVPPGVTMLPTARARRRFTVAGSAAAAVILLLAGGVVFGAVHGHPGRVASSTVKAGAPNQRVAVSSTGRDYTRADLPSAVPGLVHPLAASAGAAAPTPLTRAPSQAPGDSGANSAAGAPDTHALDRLHNQTALRTCLTELAGSATVAPLALDYAQFEGAPALIVVLPGTGTGPSAGSRADVFVVGPGCTTDDAQVRYVVRVPRPV